MSASTLHSMSCDRKGKQKKGNEFISTLAYVRSDEFSTGVTLEAL
jgi:hypothetical protein